MTNEGWKVVHDPSGTMGPYAYKGDQWVSFDDVRMIRHKSQFVKNRKLGGAMIWALDLDDFGSVFCLLVLIFPYTYILHLL